jgi:uncharacterized membrane protein
MSLPAVLLLPLLMKNSLKRLAQAKVNTLKRSFIASLLNLCSMYFILWSLRLGTAGKGIAIFQATTIISVLVGIFILKERKNVVKKIIGSTITITGAWLLV